MSNVNRARSMGGKPITPKAIKALSLLRGTSRNNTRSAKALACTLWPEKFAGCGTSLRRVGLCRSAGAYYSKLAKQGLCGHWMDEFSSGYFITEKGAMALASQ